MTPLGMFLFWIAFDSLLLLYRNGLVRGCRYTTTVGDTVSQLAAAQGCDAKDIRDANPGTDYWGPFEAGTIVLIPEACECPAYPDCVVTTISNEENLGVVAKNRGCFTQYVEAVNSGLPEHLPPGTQVNIPTEYCRCSVDVVGCGYAAQTGDTVDGLLERANCLESAADSFRALNPGLFPEWISNMFVVPLDFIVVIPPVCDCPQVGPLLPEDSGGPSAPGLTDDASPSSDSTRWLVFGMSATASVATLVAVVLALLFLRRRRAARRRHAVQEAIVAATPGASAADASSRDTRAVSKRDVTHTDTGSVSERDVTRTDTPSCGPENVVTLLPSCAGHLTGATSVTATRVSTPREAQAGSTAGSQLADMSWLSTTSFARTRAATGNTWMGPQLLTQSCDTRSSRSPVLDAPVLRYDLYQTAVDHLQDVLDDMHGTSCLLLSRWTVLSSNERRIGGQGVVQFVWDTKTRQDHVAKFFLNDATFQREAQLYRRPHVREMMAAVVHMQEAGVETASGSALPSFIVLKRGKSLDEWALKRKPDFVTSLQVLMQIVDRLVNLHDAGYVHRDLKPANIMWRIEDSDWTLIDFGCIADLSESSKAHLSFSLPYAPPEVARAVENDQSSIKVDPALDMWSLGVVVYELLTGERVFSSSTTERVIFDQLLGRAPLPWEEGAPEERRNKTKRLGLLRRAVLSCLSRVPSQRPTARSLLLTLNSLFQVTQGKPE